MTFETKRLIAREWLLFVSLMIVGFLLVSVLYFREHDEHQDSRKTAYETILRRFFLGSFSEFQHALDDSKTRRQLFDTLQLKLGEYQNAQRHHLYDTLLTLIFKLPAYETYNHGLDKESIRTDFYDFLKRDAYGLPSMKAFETQLAPLQKFALIDYDSFQLKYYPPPLFSGIGKCFRHLFSRIYWLRTWLSIFMVYFFASLFRTLIWAFRILSTKQSVAP